jgi:hypothetical protein
VQVQSSRFLAFAPLLDPLIQRLQHSRIYRGDHIDRSIQFFFRHPRFPCVRKAPVHSRIAEPHHCDGETDEHLFAVGETFDGVRIAVESSEIGFLQGSWLLFVNPRLIKILSESFDRAQDERALRLKFHSIFRSC